MNKVEKFRQRFDNMGVFDVAGKNYRKPYVENLEVYAIKIEEENEKLTGLLCEECGNHNDGQFTGKCHICPAFYKSQWRAK